MRIRLPLPLSCLALPLAGQYKMDAVSGEVWFVKSASKGIASTDSPVAIILPGKAED